MSCETASSSLTGLSNHCLYIGVSFFIVCKSDRCCPSPTRSSLLRKPMVLFGCYRFPPTRPLFYRRLHSDTIGNSIILARKRLFEKKKDEEKSISKNATGAIHHFVSVQKNRSPRQDNSFFVYRFSNLVNSLILAGYRFVLNDEYTLICD